MTQEQTEVLERLREERRETERRLTAAEERHIEIHRLATTRFPDRDRTETPAPSVD